MNENKVKYLKLKKKKKGLDEERNIRRNTLLMETNCKDVFLLKYSSRFPFRFYNFSFRF